MRSLQLRYGEYYAKGGRGSQCVQLLTHADDIDSMDVPSVMLVQPLVLLNVCLLWWVAVAGI